MIAGPASSMKLEAEGTTFRLSMRSQIRSGTGVPASTKILPNVTAVRTVGTRRFTCFVLDQPEGGWTDAEISAACKCGFHSVTLGAGILKAETAAIVGGALIRYELEERTGRNSEFGFPASDLGAMPASFGSRNGKEKSEAQFHSRPASLLLLFSSILCPAAPPPTKIRV
jgi:hypothetical protein